MKAIWIAALAIATAVHAQQPKAEPEPKEATATRIVLVGDSTVNHSTGWGSGFCDRLAGEIECFNESRNGRSSKSYRDQGLWKRALALNPNIVLIQFGANDTPGKGADRETVPNTSFAALLRLYISEARAIGAKPMLVTPLPGRSFKDGKHVHTLEDYAAAMRTVGAETKTPVLDLNTDANAVLDTMTQEQADKLNHIYEKDKPSTDRVHLDQAGIDLFGLMVAKEFAAAMPSIEKKIVLF